MSRVLVIGEILVEVMATAPGHGFREPLDLRGPFPSGAPAIFADQCARQGAEVALLGRVGDDDFGHMTLDRLRAAGVDCSAVGVDGEAVTGSAFVRYRPDGARDFVFNITGSAAGRLARDAAAEAQIARASHLHVMGSSLVTPAIAELVLFAAEEVKARGGTLSFDPNIRPEILGAGGIGPTLARVLALTDLFLPSEGEARMFTDAPDEEAALAELLARGIGTIVQKRGARGARLLTRAGEIALPGFPVNEVDPTGAGDTFGATFLALWLAGTAPETCLLRAAAAGALAVTRRGPMEGASDPAALDAVLSDQRAV